ARTDDRPSPVAKMARFGVRSGSRVSARADEDPATKRFERTGAERARTVARTCHSEGRGFESHHPLSEKPRSAGGVFLRSACTSTLVGAAVVSFQSAFRLRRCSCCVVSLPFREVKSLPSSELDLGLVGVVLASYRLRL